MSLNNKHILIVTPGFTAGDHDSTCIPPLFLYVKELKKQYPDLRISIIAIHYPFVKESYLFHGATVYPLNGRNKRNPVSKLLLQSRIKKIVSEINHKSKISLVHSFWMDEAAFYSALISKKYKISHLCTLMGQDARNVSVFGKKSLAVSENLQTVTLSEFHNEEFQKSYFRKSHYVIQWGIDEIETSFVKREIDIAGVGNLIQIKDFIRFIEIIFMLKKKIPEIKVKIIGKGPLENELKAQIKKFQLEKNIEIKGELPRTEVLNLLQHSKMLLHTSTYESFGYVLIEALASGCHVVSTPVGFAYQNDSISTFITNEEAVDIILKKLSIPVNKAKNIPTMKETVRKYSEIYLTEIHFKND